MAFTKGFKTVATAIVIVAVCGVGAWQGDKHNYWGLLDKKPEPVVQQQVQETPPPVREVAPTQPYNPPAQRAQQEYQPAPPAQQEDSAPVPTQRRKDSVFGKMKSLDQQ